MFVKIVCGIVAVLGLFFLSAAKADDYGNEHWTTQRGEGQFRVVYRWDSVNKRTFVVKEDGTPYQGVIFLRSRFSLTPEEHTKAMLFWEQPKNREKMFRYQSAVKAGR